MSKSVVSPIRALSGGGIVDNQKTLSITDNPYIRQDSQARLPVHENLITLFEYDMTNN